MTRRWPSLAALTVAACVGLDPAGPPVRDISGTYTATIVTRIENQFETLSHTLAATLTLGNTGDRGQFVGSYHLLSGETGPFGGTLRTDDSLIVTEFGEPPKPIAGVSEIRSGYPWCDFTRLGIGRIPGAFRNDSLFADGVGSVPCFYGTSGGFLVNTHTQVFLAIAAAR
ncbi:MAG: hypothetical protein WD773_04810 [Gemmatimonadales bacterium]